MPVVVKTWDKEMEGGAVENAAKYPYLWYCKDRAFRWWAEYISFVFVFGCHENPVYTRNMLTIED